MMETNMGNRRDIECLVAGYNANSEPELIRVTVSCTEAGITVGDHIAEARDEAEKRGFEISEWAADEDDPAYRLIAALGSPDFSAAQGSPAPLPCVIPCPKCGSMDIYRLFRPKDAPWDGAGSELAPEEFFGPGKGISMHLRAATRECIQHRCRTCRHVWVSDTLEAIREARIRGLVQELEASMEQHTPPGAPVVWLKFRPQAWVKDNAVDADPEGDSLWPVSLERFLKMFPTRKDWDSEHWDRDEMRLQGAPRWIRNWSGPFEVELADDRDPWDEAGSNRT
jgi:hypothetical protein